jgi:small-conductance mechanosensitive channel
MFPRQFFADQGGYLFSLLLGRVGLALVYILVAVIAAWLLPPLVQRSVLKWAKMRTGDMSERRQNTISRMMLYLTKAGIITITVLAVLSLFVNSTGLLTFVGLFTAGFGFAIRGIISDYISGFIFLFEDPFAIGDDVEIGGERGRVEDVTLRIITLRAPSGEARIVPNGDIRTVHNYTREKFNQVIVNVGVAPAQLATAFGALEKLASQLPREIPALLEAPQVLVEEGALGDSITIAVRATARIDSETAVRLRLMESMRRALAENDIEITTSA